MGFVQAFRRHWLAEAMTLIASLGGGVAFIKVLAPERDVRDGLAAGAFIFTVVALLLIYGSLNDLTSSAPCQLFAAPTHAKLTARGGAWESNGLLWIGIACDAGSALHATITTAVDSSLAPVARESLSHLWDKIFDKERRIEKWSVDINRTQARVTALGQFYVYSAVRPSPETSIVVKAWGSGPGGLAFDSELKIGLFVDSEQEFKPLPPVAPTPSRSVPAAGEPGDAKSPGA